VCRRGCILGLRQTHKHRRRYAGYNEACEKGVKRLLLGEDIGGEFLISNL